jgi:lysophospholipid acyltransferase (LPLAT)-like uncharacterized protein
VKIESRRLMNLIGRAGAGITRGILASSRVTQTADDHDWHPRRAGRDKSYILALWHESLVVGAWWCGRAAPFHTIASPSKDGEIIAGCAASLGMDVIRGSSSQGGVMALRQVVTTGNSQERFRCAVTPDGPRGPRREMKSGVVYIASRLKLPIVCLGVACKNGWRLGSWDRMCIPKPFQRIHIHLSAPVWPSEKLSRDGIEEFSRFLQVELDRVQLTAEQALERRPREPVTVVRRAA